jgi:D-amino peptidase
MKIYISADFEGATGVVTPNHVLPERGPEFEKIRYLWQGDIQAMIDGASEAGGKEFLINEAHFEMTYLLPETLPSSVRYIQGHVKPDFHMCGIDSSFHAAFLLTHSGAGMSPTGVLSHTWLAKDIYAVRLNGNQVGEMHMNAVLAGYYGVPVAMVVGDVQTCKEAQEFLGDVVCVATKEGIDRFAAKLLIPEESRTLIRSGAKEAVSRVKSFKPKRLIPPIRLEIDFTGPTMAMICSFIPGVERIGPRTIRYAHEDYRSIYNLNIVFQILARAPFVKDLHF